MSATDFSSLFELLPIGAYRSSPAGRQLRANPALVRLNGYASEAELLAAVNDIAREWYVEPERRAEFATLLARDGHVVDFVSEIYRHKTRERIWIRETAHVVRDAAGAVVCYEGTVEDVTAQRQMQVALEASERRFRALTEKAQVLIVVCDPAGLISYASPAARRLLGRDPCELVGSEVFAWIHVDDREQARLGFGEVVDSRNPGTESVERFAHADGGWRHLATLGHNCLADPAVGGIVLNLRDVTERQRAHDALRRLADHDPLTDLANRRLLEARLGHALARSVTRTRRLNALLFIDLDDFKSINDTLGHGAGDCLLQATARRLVASVRSVDTVARLGGDEFMVLLEDIDADRAVAQAQATAVAAKILELLRGPAADGTAACPVSLGLTLFGDREEPVAEVMKRADLALYAAKRGGRGRLSVQ